MIGFLEKKLHRPLRLAELRFANLRGLSISSAAPPIVK
jgi:hypothetical protein